VIAGIILAAGTSSRLGRPKQLLELRGKTILQHVIDAAGASKLDETVVVLGHEAAGIEAALDLPRGTRIVINPVYAEGQATSLRAGVASLGEDCRAAVILLGDQPQMTAELIDRVIDEWQRSESAIVRATFGGEPGHPVLVARSGFKLVERAHGDEGLRSVFGPGGRGVRELVLGDTPLEDIDTEEQFERMRDG
jgi:molybdenum cofactor cytidylyltransferase